MATKKKMLQAAAGSATGGAGLDVNEVFSTYLYTGNGSTQTITNGIDLAGEGGLVWIKHRDSATQHRLFDTERGANISLTTSDTSANDTLSGALTSFNSDGFTLGSHGNVNANNYDLASWTFRKAPKFFDVVTWTGDGLTGRSISHNLGCTPGFIAIKATSSVSGSSGDGSWLCCARKSDGSYAVGDGTSSTSAYGFGFNKTTESYGTTSSSNAATHITDSAFSIQYVTGDGSGTQFLGNTSGATYVAYLFAHNDGDGGFGPDGDQDIIKCGSYSQSSASDVDVDLGFEPQFVIVKRSDDTSQWYILDEMRGFLAGSNSTSSRTLYASLANAEADFTIQKTATGFTWPSGQYGSGTQEYIYIAIRRGPLAQPESGTEVFAPNFYGTNGYTGYLGAPADMHMLGYRNGGPQNAIVSNRMIQGNKALVTSSTAAETTVSNSWDNMSGVTPVGTTLTTLISYTWKRAPGFFDVVAYTGNGTASRTVPHNLGVAPEMIIVKKRSSSTNSHWTVYNPLTLSSNNVLYLHLNSALTSNAGVLFGDGTTAVAPTDTEFTLGSFDYTNGSGQTYIAYLFATLPGVSKVGSYTGNGTSQTIDCGFTTGARFILIKRTDSTGDWYVWDTERGIVAGNDPHLSLNTTAVEVTTDDSIDPDSSGFIVNQDAATNVNVSSATYIFYAIA